MNGVVVLAPFSIRISIVCFRILFLLRAVRFGIIIRFEIRYYIDIILLHFATFVRIPL